MESPTKKTAKAMPMSTVTGGYSAQYPAVPGVGASVPKGGNDESTDQDQ